MMMRWAIFLDRTYILNAVLCVAGIIVLCSGSLWTSGALGAVPMLEAVITPAAVEDHQAWAIWLLSPIWLAPIFVFTRLLRDIADRETVRQSSRRNSR